MASLPPEMITYILSRIPVKSLLRFTCVSKSWYSLIRSPDFIKLHLKQTLASKSDGHLIICQRFLYIAELDLEAIHNPLQFSELHHPLKPNPDEVFILGSCNGILCISDFTRNNVFLYNPLTKWEMKLRVNYIIDFQIRRDQVIYGFGYDSITDDYKVFSFFQTLDNLNLGVLYSEAQVFSLKNNCWKSVEKLSNLDCIQNFLGVYLNEAVYYIVHSMKSFMRDTFIVKFDFRTDTLLRVKSPNYDAKHKLGSMLDLSALDGCLCVLVKYFPEGSFPQMPDLDAPMDSADLWMMKNETWVRLFSIRDPCSIGIQSMISTVVFSKNGRKILLEVDQSKHGWYDLEDGRFERITTLGHPPNLGCAPCFFFGTLVSLPDHKLHLQGGSIPVQEEKKKKKKKEKRDLDKFLSMGFKLKL